MESRGINGINGYHYLLMTQGEPMMERLNPDLQLFVIVIITVESFLRTFGEQINISDDISGYHSLVAPCWLYFYILLTYAPFTGCTLTFC